MHMMCYYTYFVSDPIPGRAYGFSGQTMTPAGGKLSASLSCCFSPNSQAHKITDDCI
eukprot:COSAG01_NODE_5804_length_4022_cov_63.314555_5_plen_57_part_00